MQINFEKNEDFSAYVRDLVKKAGLNQYQLAEKLGKSQAAINHALNRKKFSDTSRNGTRAEILDYLGFSVNTIIQIEKK